MAILKALRVGDNLELKPAGARWLKIPGHGDDNAKMSGFILESEDGTDYWLWLTDAGILYRHTSEPATESTGTALTGTGLGDVTAASAFGTDNLLIRSDGAVKGVQSSGITVAQTTDNMSGVGTLGCGEITVADGSSINLQEAVTFTGATTWGLERLRKEIDKCRALCANCHRKLHFYKEE